MFFARVRWIGRVLDGAGIDTYSKTGRELTSSLVSLSKCYQERNRRGEGASRIRYAIGPSGWALVAAILAPGDSSVTEHLSEALGLTDADTSTLLERVRKAALELAKQEIPDALASMTEGKPFFSSKYQPINLSELRTTFKGSPFSQLIEHHLNRQNQDQRIQDGNGLKAMLSDEARELAMDFIDRWNLRGYDQSFWQTDAASIFDEVTQDAKNILSEKDLPINDEILLNFFNIVVLNYAYSAYDQPKMRKFMGI